MSRTPVAQYKPGETFTCTKRQFDPTQPDGIGEACGAEVKIHGYHWCAQVCPKCLANYHIGFGTDMGLYLDYAGFYPADTAARVRANIAGNGGQYVPTFN
jgi:hypothetical protein